MKKHLLLLTAGLFAVITFSYSQEAIVGGDMESSSDWTFLSDPSQSDATTAIFGYTADHPKGGSGGCLELSATGTAAGYVYQQVTVVPGHKYKFDCLIKNIATDPITVAWAALILGDKQPAAGFDADSADFNYIKHPWLPAPLNSFDPMDTTMFGTSQLLLKKGTRDNTGAYVDSILTSDTIIIQNDSPTSLYVTIRVGCNNNLFDFLIDNVTLYDVTNPQSSISQTSAENNISIFPNPSTGLVNIKSVNSNKEINYDLFDVSGTLVKSGKIISNQSLDLRSFNKGIYIIKLGNRSSVEFHKLILE